MKKLEELFDVDETPLVTSTPQMTDREISENRSMLAELEQFDGRLRQLDGESDARELDNIAVTAMNHFDNLMDLGMATDPRFGASIFDAASKLMGHAITARTNKIEKALKIRDLEIKERRLAIQEKQNKMNTDDDLDSGARVMDRNEMMALIRDATVNSADSDK